MILQYEVLTGLGILFEECRDKEVPLKVKTGRVPYINPLWESNSFAEGELVKVIRQCWERNPEDRPTVGDLVTQLRMAVEQNRQLQTGAR